VWSNRSLPLKPKEMSMDKFTYLNKGMAEQCGFKERSMGAKDTVMNEKQLEELLQSFVLPQVVTGFAQPIRKSPRKLIAERQAEITWAAAEKEGMQKVVEWVEKNSEFVILGADSYRGIPAEKLQELRKLAGEK
jgi:hypothetical protein